MHVHLQNDVRESASGMGKFFSPASLRRYRNLIDDKTDARERVRVLKVLAEEWEAFAQECRMTGVAGAGSKTSSADDEIEMMPLTNQAIGPAQKQSAS